MPVLARPLPDRSEIHVALCPRGPTPCARRGGGSGGAGGTHKRGECLVLTLARAGVPKEQRSPVSIYLDEAQMFVKHESDLGEALEQSRSMNVAWCLAHQHRTQMPASLLAGIAANARNKIQFQADPVDAAAVTKHSALTPEDVMKLPPYHVYVDLMSSGVQSGWFSAVTLPPPVTLSDPDAVLAESRLRYGSQATEHNSTASDSIETDGEGDVGITLEGDGAGDEGDVEPIGRRRKARP